MNYLLIALNLANKVMDKLPDYDQRKKQDFVEKKTKLSEEWAKPYTKRDDDLILNLQDELSAFLIAFHDEVTK